MTPAQRWNTGRETWAAPAFFDPSKHGVDVLEEGPAKAFVVKHHYSGTYPSARLRVGLYRKGRVGLDLAGVAVYSTPMSQAVIPKWCGVPPSAGVELGRFVLLDEVERNGESWFLARAFEALRASLPEVRALLSFSDPVPRVVRGVTTTPGHVGTIYQAHNGRHVGRAGRNTIYLTPSGDLVSARALSKVRSGDRGHAYAEAQLEAFGAPRRSEGESGRSWLGRLLSSGWLRTARHPGNLAYVWAVGDRRTRRKVEEGLREPLAYPKRPDSVLTPAHA